MTNNYSKLCEILKQNNDCVTEEGELLKNKVQEKARKLDSNLLKVLLSNNVTKEMFFTKIDDIYVFDANKFCYMVESQEFLPDSYTQYKQSILLVDEYGKSIKKTSDVVLEFPNKDCILEFDSTDVKIDRPEVMLNETLMKKEITTLLDHKVLVNAKRYTKDGMEENVTSFNNDNLLIKGNNLLTLYSLYPKYKGQIKLMYWDILYNTDNDKVPYNDSFKHSSWLVMMKNRLEIAQKLLKDDGVIVIQCDKNEDAYLKVICDEIFGRNNFVNSITIQTSTPSGNKTQWKNKTIIKIKDTILIYKKQDIDIKPQYTSKNRWDTHYSNWFEIINEEKNEYKIIPLREKLIEDGIIDKKTKIDENIIFNKKFYDYCITYKDNIVRTSPSMPTEIKNESKKKQNTIIKYFDTNGHTQYAYNGNRICFLSSSIKTLNGKEQMCQLLCDIWTDIDFNNTQNEGQNSLPSGKKPEALLKRIIEMFTNEKDIVLDAYLGSGTTAAVCHKLNRRYIGIEQLDNHFNMSCSRIQHVINGEQDGISDIVNWQGGGSFVSCELANDGQTIVEKIIKANTTEEFIEIYEEIKTSPFVLYRVDINKMEEEKDKFLSLLIEDKKIFLLSIIDKNTLYINYSDIDNNDFFIKETDKLFTNSFYKGE